MSKAPEKYESLGYFNLARSLGMVWIVLGHSISPFFAGDSPEQFSSVLSNAGSVLGGGVMAMFFMMSGFGFYRRSPRKCLMIQTRLLLKPYWVSAAAILITKIVLSLLAQRPFEEHGGELVLTYLLGLNAEGGGMIGGISVESVSIFWFILALFGGWNLYNAICQLKSEKMRLILTIGCVIAGYLLTKISSVWPFCLPMALLSTGYLAAGDEIRKRQLLDRKLPLWCWVLLILISGICAVFGSVNIVACQWKLGLLDVAGSFCVGFLLLRLYRKIKSRNLWEKVTRPLEAVGFYSLSVVCLHGYEKVIFPWYRLNLLFPDAPVLCVLVCFLARCAVMYMFFRLLALASRILRRKHRKGSITIEP